MKKDIGRNKSTIGNAESLKKSLKKRVCPWDGTNYVVRKKSRNETANAVSSFLRQHRGRSVVSDKGS